MSEDIILHWYLESPFSQKIEWILNYKNINYKKVQISMVEPRPLRRPLDGGYRKTPILQIGNHVYCDTKVIIHALEKRFPIPSLYPQIKTTKESTEALSIGLNLWLESSVFVKVGSQFPAAFLTEKFKQDRREFFGAAIDPTSAPFIRQALLGEFGVIQQLLGDKIWIFDTETPSSVDVTVTMLVFFTVRWVGEEWVRTNISILYSHMKRVLAALKWENINTTPNMTEEEAIEVLKKYNSTSAITDNESNTLPFEIGIKVKVTPMDRGACRAKGKLVMSTEKEIVIEYKDDSFNTTSYIHFPTVEYMVLPDNIDSQ